MTLVYKYMYMIEHNFHIIDYWHMGPMRNRAGYTFIAAKIDEIWILRWTTPHGVDYFKYFSNHRDLMSTVHLISR
jgi:hypothetical protein